MKPNSVSDKAIQKFAEMIIERLKSINGNWEQPWFSGKKGGMPQNLSGRKYNGMNSIMLLMEQMTKGYTLPVFITYYQAKEQGCNVNKGEKSFPIFLWNLYIRDEDGNRISLDEYNSLSHDDKKKCMVRPSAKVYNVFNIEQTDFPTVQVDRWEKLKEKFFPNKPEEEREMFSVKEIDDMIKENRWLCPIQHGGNSAAYNPSTDKIRLPEKNTFINGEEYYSTALHEITHSTGIESRLNRDMGGGFGSPKYAREELVAELTSALLCHNIGIANGVQENNIKYIKGWMKSISDDPNFLMSILGDVSKANSLINSKIYGEEISVSEKEGTDEAENIQEASKEQLANLKDFDNLKEKKEKNNALLIFRDFNNNLYHIYKEDAERASKVLNLEKNTIKGENGELIPIVSFKCYELDTYLPKLIDAGMKIAICDTLVNETKKEETIGEKVDRYTKNAEAYYKRAYKKMSKEINDKYSYSDSFINEIFNTSSDELINEHLSDDRNSLAKAKEWKTEPEIVKIIERKENETFTQNRINGTAAEHGELVAHLEKNIADAERALALRAGEVKLHMAHLGNGITLWEDNSNGYKAHISPDRQLTIYDNYKFSEKNMERISDIVKNGNYIVNNNNQDKDLGYLALNPINKPSLKCYNELTKETYFLSVEKVNGKNYACYGRQIFSDNPYKYDKILENDSESINSNNLNQKAMGEKKTKNDNEEKPAIQQEEKNEQKHQDGVSVFKMQNGFYGINVTRNGERSVTHKLSQEDTQKYFEGLKGQPKEEIDRRRQELAEKYFSKESKKEIKTLPEAKKEDMQRISAVSIYKMTDGKNYAVRCKIDGEQQMGKKIPHEVVASFFDGYKGMEKEAQEEKKANVAAIMFNDILNPVKQEQQQGMKR